MTMIPRKDKRKDELEKKRKEAEELRNALQKATERKEREITYESYQHGRRKFVKYVGLGTLVAAVLGISGAVAYFSSMNNPSTSSFQNQQNQPSEQQISQQETQNQQSQVVVEEGESWPLRATLTDLKNAQEQIGSTSKYILPLLSPDEAHSILRGGNSPYVTSLANEQLLNKWSDIFSENMYGSKLQNSKLILHWRPNDYLTTDQVAGIVEGYYSDGRSDYAGFGGSPNYIVEIFEPNDTTDRVYFVSPDGRKKLYGQG